MKMLNGIHPSLIERNYPLEDSKESHKEINDSYYKSLQLDMDLNHMDSYNLMKGSNQAVDVVVGYFEEGGVALEFACVYSFRREKD